MLNSKAIVASCSHTRTVRERDERVAEAAYQFAGSERAGGDETTPSSGCGGEAGAWRGSHSRVIENLVIGAQKECGEMQLWFFSVYIAQAKAKASAFNERSTCFSQCKGDQSTLCTLTAEERSE